MNLSFLHLFTQCLLPDSRVEENQQREQLQSPCQHIKNQHILGKVGEPAEIAGRSDQLQARSDIVEGGSDCREIGYKVFALQRKQEDGAAKNQQIVQK